MSRVIAFNSWESFVQTQVTTLKIRMGMYLDFSFQDDTIFSTFEACICPNSNFVEPVRDMKG